MIESKSDNRQWEAYVEIEIWIKIQNSNGLRKNKFLGHFQRNEIPFGVQTID